jgi:anthranilate/para-aminobenzoate synthase component I
MTVAPDSKGAASAVSRAILPGSLAKAPKAHAMESITRLFTSWTTVSGKFLKLSRLVHSAIRLESAVNVFASS